MAELADVIENEARLDALRRAALLDSPPEEAFDRLTRLATTVLRVPVALVALVDGDRQFFKSHCGLAEPLASSRQTPLTHSFCQHAVGSREPLVVADARRDPRFGHDHAFSGLGGIAYAGIPLITSDGYALGTFCVVDRRPHDWTEEEIGILRVLASSTMSEIELRRLVDEQRALTATLQRLVEARTSELRTSEERQARSPRREQRHRHLPRSRLSVHGDRSRRGASDPLRPRGAHSSRSHQGRLQGVGRGGPRAIASRHPSRDRVAPAAQPRRLTASTNRSPPR